MLDCEETIMYQNNSPDVLNGIYFHTWPNAFANNKTPYGKEAVVNGNFHFLQADKEERGFLEGLDFKVNGVQAQWSYQGNSEIAYVTLPEPLQPGQSVAITTPFRVKIPFLFSRMGYEGSLFSITQWYPKPAVYDANGWAGNYFPYQEQGEYYSEFGTYEVQITLPENYIVGATGELQNEEEKDWLSELADGSAVKRSGTKLKTLTYKQENVPDFAWFADTSFTVGESNVKLSSGKTVHTYAFISSNSYGSVSRVLESIETALTYYGKRVGEYPYNYCSVVVGKLTAAGGMEYPMITICGSADEGTVIHEVGHNWFQCVLGSHERNYPWMDESINTFYQNYAEGKAPKDWKVGNRIQPTGDYFNFRFTHDFGYFQPGNIRSEKYISKNYGAIVYSANPFRFSYLQEYLGKRTFDSCMQMYFATWKFKHPLPGDIQQTFEKYSGENLNWFFKGLLGDALPDAAIRSVKKDNDGLKVRVKSTGKYTVPVKLEYTELKKSKSIWIHSADTALHIPQTSEIILNPTGFYTETDMTNNQAKGTGVFRKMQKLKIGFPDLYHRGWNKVWFMPQFFSGNLYDGYTPGIILSNITMPRRKTEWWIQTSYGTKSKKPVGSAGIFRNLYFENGPFAMAQVFATSKSYSFQPDSAKDMHQYGNMVLGTQFYLKRIKPWVQHNFGFDMTFNRISGFYQKLNVDGSQTQNRPPIHSDYQNDLYRFYWNRESYKKAMPASYFVALEAGNNYNYNRKPIKAQDFGFVKLSSNAKWFVPYHFFKAKGYGLHAIVFASSMLHTSTAGPTKGVYYPVVSGAQGKNDYAYAETLIGRSENPQTSPFLGRQLLGNTPGMRMLPGITANRYAAGINVSSAIVPKVPLHIIADAVLANNNGTKSFYWSAGVNTGVRLGVNTLLEFNLPLIYSSNFNSAMAGYKWYQAWNFKLNVNLINPFKLTKSIYL